MKLVLIEWLDSFGCSPNWQPLDAVLKEPMQCRSVGWLLHDGPHCKVIVPHISDEDTGGMAAQGCGDMTIPVCSIVHMTELDDRQAEIKSWKPIDK